MQVPLVSVMVVAHDAERSLGFALASVLAQSLEDWECVVVDDGSVRPLGPIVESLSDARFHYVRLAENRGRGYARQKGLDSTRGRFLAILDADDWMYPTRLETQVAYLQREPAAKTVGASMVIEDDDHRVLGVQEARAPGPFRLGALPFSFAPILTDLSLVRSIGFDPRLTRAEDVLFLNRALEEPWGSVSIPLYAYRPSTATRASALEGYRCSRMAYAACRTEHPIAARKLELAYRIRELVHEGSPESLREGIAAWSRRRHLRPATDIEQSEYARALAAVQSRAARTSPRLW